MRPVLEPSAEAADAKSMVYTAASLYYDANLSQQEVAERLGVSRSTVSRLLQQARDYGIVRIEVRPPSPVSELEVDLAGALGLRRAVVIPESVASEGPRALVAPAIDELARLALVPGDVLAVSSGETIWQVARAAGLPRLDGVRLVPALGGWDERDVRFQTNEIARRMADASGADVSLLHAPGLPSPELHRSVLSDPETAGRLALWDKLAGALVGIGKAPNQRQVASEPVLHHRHCLTDACGDVALRHFDLEGRTVEFPDEDRLLAVSRDQLRAAGTVIGVAGGLDKGPSLVGAARAKLVDIVVTDVPTAIAALDAAGQDARRAAPRTDPADLAAD